MYFLAAAATVATRAPIRVFWAAGALPVADYHFLPRILRVEIYFFAQYVSAKFHFTNSENTHILIRYMGWIINARGLTADRE